MIIILFNKNDLEKKYLSTFQEKVKRPFLDKGSLYNSATEFRIKTVLGINKVNRPYFLIENTKTNKEFVTDFNSLETEKLRKKYGDDLNNCRDKTILIYSDRYTDVSYSRPAFTLRIQLI